MAACEKVTVLKVKRKASQDPLQIIRIEHPRAKKAKTDENAVSKESVLFHLFESRIGEVNDNCILEEVEKKLNLHNSSNGPHATDGISTRKIDLTAQETKIQSFEPCNITSKSSHLKSWRRANSDDDNETSNKMLIEIFDVTKNNSAEIDQMKDSDQIYCNSIRMLRENLTISDDSAIQDEEFIYDLYYMHEQEFGSQIVSINPSDDDILYSTEHERETEKYEESDSNDEDHWKNDYPDEDHFYSSNDENSEDDSCSKSSSDSDHNYYRSRDFFWGYNSYNAEDLYNFEAYDEYDEH